MSRIRGAPEPLRRSLPCFERPASTTLALNHGEEAHLAASDQLTGKIESIQVRIQVGHDRMAGTDDPIFLKLHGPAGREFRLAGADGLTVKRDAEQVYILGPAEAPETNVAHPKLNDPTRPTLDLADITGVSILKGQEPIPNVRGIGELDDRLEIAAVQVEIQRAQGEKIIRYARKGPLWLGLASGLSLQLARV
jgi:hypothetical protein